MSQDTRKDKRAKVVSLNVRYKSATVDEFIENHSHDVSKGGIFVKTPTPFAPGTLLKFEIRLAGDKSVISGVGRVVWKREPTQAGPERPAGMGVKFIKVDDTSRVVIDKLVAHSPGAGSAYESEPAALEENQAGQPTTLKGIPAARPAEPKPEPAPKPGATGAVAMKPPGESRPKAATMMGVGVAPPPAAKAPVTTPSPSAGAPPVVAPPPRPEATSPNARKATMMGVAPPVVAPPAGALKREPSPPPAAVATSGRPPARDAEPMFPRLGPDSGEELVREPTVMKQAAELLEEALKEAGGSLEEIGQNPLFTTSSAASQSLKEEESDSRKRGGTVVMNAPESAGVPSPLGTPPPPAAPPAPTAPIEPPPPAAPPPALAVPQAKTPEPEKKRNGSAGLIVALLVVLGAGGLYAYKSGLLAGVIGPGHQPPPTVTTPLPPPPSAAASGSAPARASTSAIPAATTADASAAGDAAVSDAAAAADAASKAGAKAEAVHGGRPAATAAIPPPAPRPRPTATATATATTTATATATATSDTAPTTTEAAAPAPSPTLKPTADTPPPTE